MVWDTGGEDPEDALTGARADVELLVGLASEQVWDLVTDLGHIGAWSPECVGAAWCAPDTGPRVGARFEAHNRYPDGFTAEVTCVVTAAERPHRFDWIVLDDDADPDRPGSVWHYRLLPGGAPDRTLVRHGFVHGPGRTGLREATRCGQGTTTEAADAARRVERRLAVLRANMTLTLAAMARAHGAVVATTMTDDPAPHAAPTRRTR